MRSNPTVLLLASRLDLTTDLVVSKLRDLGLQYLRLNSQDLADLDIVFEPSARRVEVSYQDRSWVLCPSTLRAIVYRRPTFFSEVLAPPEDAEECLGRAHWLTFFRSLMVFSEAIWINSPLATYRAENKPFQLAEAFRLGFKVPSTLITNVGSAVNAIPSGQVAVKGIDTVRVAGAGHESFGYTQVHSREIVSAQDLSTIPTILQEFLSDKVDIRVTVVGDEVFAVAITKDGQPIQGDWRLCGSAAATTPTDLPADVEHLCRTLVQELGLTFGAIDLAKTQKGYFFLEINPTGEWGWIDRAGLPIAEALARLLEQASR